MKVLGMGKEQALWFEKLSDRRDIFSSDPETPPDEPLASCVPGSLLLNKLSRFRDAKSS